MDQKQYIKKLEQLAGVESRDWSRGDPIAVIEHLAQHIEQKNMKADCRDCGRTGVGNQRTYRKSAAGLWLVQCHACKLTQNPVTGQFEPGSKVTKQIVQAKRLGRPPKGQ